MGNEEATVEIIKRLEARHLGILVASKKKAQDDALAKPTAKNLEALAVATKMLDEYLAPPEPEKEPAFANRKEVLEHLNRNGYTIGQTKLYDDAKKGLLKIENDRTVLESSVKTYIRKAQLEKPSDIKIDSKSENLILEKQSAELKKLTAQYEDLIFKTEILKGKYVPWEKVETEQAIKAGAFRAGLQHLYQTHFRDCIKLVGGDVKKNQEAINFWIEKTLDLLDEFARLDSIEVKVEI